MPCLDSSHHTLNNIGGRGGGFSSRGGGRGGFGGYNDGPPDEVVGELSFSLPSLSDIVSDAFFRYDRDWNICARGRRRDALHNNDAFQSTFLLFRWERTTS